MVVSELVRQNRAHLVHRQDLHERKAEAHTAPASNSHEAAALGDPSVDIRNQINVPWWILPSCFSHRIEHLEKLWMVRWHKLRTGRFKAVRTWHDRPKDDASADNAG